MEVLVASGLFLLFALGIYGATTLVFKIVYSSRLRILETALISEQLEVVRNLPFDDVGIINGVPAGVLPYTTTTVRNGVIFVLITTVRNIDDPFDGTITSTPADVSPADYKLVEISAICQSCTQINPVILSTRVAPKNLEGASENGALFIHVFDVNGLNVAGAIVDVTNTAANPFTIINDTTDNAGMVQIIGAPTGTQSYHIRVSKSGYSSDYTVSSSAQVPNPVKPPSNVVSQAITEISFQIDQAGALNFSTVNANCAAVASVPLSVHGEKIIGTSPAMQDLFQKIERIAPLDLTILILGETGTGKEMVAREIHKRSLRGDKPFIAINCGAIPENLLESILFGHKKGAFTGAVADKMGKFEAAHGGTIFLDEIAEMPLHLQVKLLRVLQEKVVERVGDLKEQKTDVRVIAATHQILEEMIKKGVFREDLYYRLNEIYLSIPPLRERAGDIVLLAKHFIDKYKGILGTGEKILTEKSLEKILNYPWPGNIRELENIIKRTLVFSNSEEINENHLDIGESSPTLLPLKEAKEKFMRDYVQKVLALQNGNKEKTSKILGISVRTLFRIEKA